MMAIQMLCAPYAHLEAVILILYPATLLATWLSDILEIQITDHLNQDEFVYIILSN